jgi:hypothetical protein
MVKRLTSFPKTTRCPPTIRRRRRTKILLWLLLAFVPEIAPNSPPPI